ncbi:MAG TPA: transposase, partial [Patescibacteria group bacterium]|nr:transposase [Patescibacteria group bacterium]
ERLPWRYFCHLSLTDTVPDATTLIKLNLRFGEERIAGLNKQLVGHLVKQRAIKPRRIRIDSTTLEAHIAYPTDIGILHQAVRTLTRTATSLGQKIVSHVRATKKALARWGASSKANPKERKAQGKKILKKVTQLATDTQTQSRQALKQLSVTAPSQIKQKFSQTIELTEKLVEQTQDKLAGKGIAERMVSFFDPEARAIVKGKLDKPVEFGRTLQLVQDDSGVIVHYEIHRGNPSDKTELISLVRQTKKVLKHAPRELATDRGYYSSENLNKLHRLGVRRVGIPKIGRLSRAERKHQHCGWFRELQRFRCGIEAGISLLKRRFSLGRVLAKGSPATAVWTGLAIFAFNLWQQT